MVNEIKFDQIDKISNFLTPKKNTAPTQSESDASKPDVSVEMKAYRGLMITDNTPEDNARLLEIKNKIDAHSYQIDTDALATKLFKQVFSKTIG